MILQLFFVLPNLLIHLVESGIKRGADVVAFRGRDKIVLMFRVDKNFNSHLFVLKVNGDADFGHSLEKSEQLLGFRRDVLMCFGTNGAVATRDFNLHGINLSGSGGVNQAW